MKNLHARLEKIRMLILDVDGILTDGTVLIGSSGEEIKRFSIRDGYGVKLLQRLGIVVALISGRHSEATAIRAKELGIEHVHQGVSDKLPVYEDLVRNQQVSEEEVAFMGDDWMDLPLLRRAGFSATVPEASEEAREVAHYITLSEGGMGAVREIADLILKAQDPGGALRKELGLTDAREGAQGIRWGGR